MADLSGLPPAVVDTITQARAPSTRQTYALRWSLFANWCSSRRETPRRCTIGVVLSFLQERLERRLSPSTLQVYASVCTEQLPSNSVLALDFKLVSRLVQRCLNITMQFVRVLENITFCSLFTNHLRPFRGFSHHTVASIIHPSSSHRRHEMQC